MLVGGMLLLGTVDHVLDDQIRVEYKLGNHHTWIDVPVITSLCTPTEGMQVLFYREGVVKCFCSEDKK